MAYKVFNKKKMATHTVVTLLSDLTPKIDRREVVVMAIHGKYALVKRPKLLLD